jgi:hypothetical protein
MKIFTLTIPYLKNNTRKLLIVPHLYSNSSIQCSRRNTRISAQMKLRPYQISLTKSEKISICQHQHFTVQLTTHYRYIWEPKPHIAPRFKQMTELKNKHQSSSVKTEGKKPLSRHQRTSGRSSLSSSHIDTS